MANGEPSLEEPLIEFFKGGNVKSVQRVLERAQKKAEASARRLPSATRPQKRAGLLVKAMNHAMSAYGRSTKNGPSIRQVAPDTGGRPYHFGYSTLSKGQSTRGRQKASSGAGATGSSGAAPGSAGAGKAAGAKAGKGRKGANTAEAAHQIYTERDSAVDRDSPALTAAEQAAGQADLGAGAEPGHDGDAPSVDTAASRTGPDTGRAVDAREFVEGISRDGGVIMAASEAAAQAYIEDPDKLPKLMGQRSSFGTIGKTLAERLAFWDLVHERESDNGGRTQTRIVVELPHEATPDERHEIVRRFTDELRLKGIPFWASIHAPTKDNDQRNHHAHIVCTDRPMKKMPHPETGALTWDFAIEEHYKRANRANATRYPYRQNRDPEMRERGYVKKSRARLAEVVNGVMSQSKSTVRYDPRSYKDMGLDVAPMRNVARVMADKLGKRSFVVMDAEWTRKMIDAEMQAAAARRSAAFVQLQEAESELHEAAKASERAAAARRGKSPFVGKLAKAASDAAFEAVLKVKRDRLAARFVSESTAATLEHIAKATSPAEVMKRAHDPAAAPDAAAIAELHAATQEELAEHRSRGRETTKAYQVKERKLTQAWQQLFQRPLPPAQSHPAAPPQHSARGQSVPTTHIAAPPGQDQTPTAAQASPGPAPAKRGQRTKAGYIPPSGGRYAAVRAGMQAMVDTLLNLGLSGSEFAEASKAMVADLGTANRKLRAEQEARAAAAAATQAAQEAQAAQAAQTAQAAAQAAQAAQAAPSRPRTSPAPQNQTPAAPATARIPPGRPPSAPAPLGSEPPREAQGGAVGPAPGGRAVRTRAETTADVRGRQAPPDQPQPQRPFVDAPAIAPRVPTRPPATSQQPPTARATQTPHPESTTVGPAAPPPARQAASGLTAEPPPYRDPGMSPAPPVDRRPTSSDSRAVDATPKTAPRPPGTKPAIGPAKPEAGAAAESRAPITAQREPNDRGIEAKSKRIEPPAADGATISRPAAAREPDATQPLAAPQQPAPPALTADEIKAREKEEAARRRRKAILAARRRDGPGM